MSRVGKAPIPLPKGVSVTLGAAIAVKGPKGNLSMPAHPLVQVEEKDGQLLVSRKSDDRHSRSAHGLIRALTANMVTGVSEGFKRGLEINGVGYRAEAKGKSLVLNLGFSHPIDYELPEGVTAKVEKNIITLEGADKQVLGQAAAEVRAFRPPEPYKGKGVRYVGEHVARKVGKTAG